MHAHTYRKTVNKSFREEYEWERKRQQSLGCLRKYQKMIKMGQRLCYKGIKLKILVQCSNRKWVENVDVIDFWSSRMFYIKKLKYAENN